MHDDDDLLLDTVRRLTDEAKELSSAIADMVVRLGGRVVRVEKALEESKRDRAQLRFILGVVVLIFVLAIAVQLWRG